MVFTSILYLLLALIPVFCYIGIIWLTTPFGSIDFKKSTQYFITGVLSIGILLTFLRIFSGWQTPMNPSDMSWSLFILAFIQVSLVEEVCKFSAFKINEVIRKDNIEYDSPIGTMFYCGISALGFSFIENVDYAVKYGGDLILIRSFTAMMLHFLCGLIMGYWISISRLPTKLRNKSILEVIFIKKPILKKIVYYFMGILSATFLHGLFDYNLFTKGHIVSNYIIIFGGVIAAYLASKDINEKVSKNH